MSHLTAPTLAEIALKKTADQILAEAAQRAEAKGDPVAAFKLRRQAEQAALARAKTPGATTLLGLGSTPRRPEHAREALDGDPSRTPRRSTPSDEMRRRCRG